MKKTTVLVLTILVWASSASAQKLAVKVIDRQDNDTDYTYVVPAHWFSNSNTNVDCGGSDTRRGATFTLQLPDGRAAVVNCESKFKERFAGRAGNHRSCRMPLVENIDAEFHGDNAKLIWPVSLDGKKMQSETYKVLAILDKPKSEEKSQ
jgi:hypothetical protein